MTYAQIATLLNAIATEHLGTAAVVQNDLSGLDILGNSVLTSQTAKDTFVGALIDRVGKIIFDDRVYSGAVPSVLRDAFEWGTAVEKISFGMPSAIDDPSVKLATLNNTVVEQDTFYKATVTAHFFNAGEAFQIALSFPADQLMSAFTSAGEMAAFIAALYNEIEKSMTVKVNGITLAAISNLAALTFYKMNSGGTYTGAGDTRCVNLLKRYNDLQTAAGGTTITAAEALTDPAFLRYAAREIMLYSERMRTISTLFNISGVDKFTPKDKQHLVLLADFATSTATHLQSDVYHDEMLKLPAYETVPFWQGSGTDYAFTSTGKIIVKTKDGTGTARTVTATGILGVLFDHDAVGVFREHRKTTQHYNANGDFFNNFFKYQANYFNDLDENFVVFYVA